VVAQLLDFAADLVDEGFDDGDFVHRCVSGSWSRLSQERHYTRGVVQVARTMPTTRSFATLESDRWARRLQSLTAHRPPLSGAPGDGFITAEFGGLPGALEGGAIMAHRIGKKTDFARP
jgi:hypothetical protein